MGASRMSFALPASDGDAMTLAEAEAEIMGDRATVRILIGPDGEVPLLGLTTLETLRLKVNPIARSLEPAKFIEYLLN